MPQLTEWKRLAFAARNAAGSTTHPETARCLLDMAADYERRIADVQRRRLAPRRS